MNYVKKPGLTGSALKWIAIITMFIDHIGVALLEIGLLPKVADAVLAGNSFDYVMADYHFWYNFDDVLRAGLPSQSSASYWWKVFCTPRM